MPMPSDNTFKGKPERLVCLPRLDSVITASTHVGQQPGYEADSLDLVYVTPD
jgi:hypothetical protein